ncbi:hypothetical protein BDQ17DRAFT_1232939 [Cyathus striatus]|nr:hypothetical protein BDQ17DRAFT_1232939 [Cyathus striatus]
MVSADNLNLDVLELIFAHLPRGDLPFVALVSRSFLSAIIPRLYETISYRIKQRKAYAGKTMSPFAVLTSRPQYAVHVRTIEIHSVPMTNQQLNSEFIRKCGQSLILCKNMQAFLCIVPNIVQYFLPYLAEKSNLKTLRAHASLTTDQASFLLQLTGLKSLNLEFASWNVVDIIPKWIESLQSTLTSITLHMISELNEQILESALLQLPGLKALHVVGCPKIDYSVVLRLVTNAPLLESLSLSTTDKTYPLPSVSLLPNLQHLSIDVRTVVMSAPSSSVLASILTFFQSSCCPLATFSIRLPEKKVTLGLPFIQQLLSAYAYTLRRISFLECSLTVESVEEICKKCVQLERLDITIPVKELNKFSLALSPSKSLRTLNDVDHHATHDPRPSLNHEKVRLIMDNVPSLKTIVSDGRIWTVRVTFRATASYLLTSLRLGPPRC